MSSQWFTATEQPGRERTISRDAVDATMCRLYALLQLQEHPDEDARIVARVRSQVRDGVGTTTLLDLHTGEEFELPASNKHARARTISPHELPEEILRLWPRHPQSGLPLTDGLDTNKGRALVDLDELRTIAHADKPAVQLGLFA